MAVTVKPSLFICSYKHNRSHYFIGLLAILVETGYGKCSGKYLTHNQCSFGGLLLAPLAKHSGASLQEPSPWAAIADHCAGHCSWHSGVSSLDNMLPSPQLPPRCISNPSCSPTNYVFSFHWGCAYCFQLQLNLPQDGTR